jgi:hypothetical protein
LIVLLRLLPLYAILGLLCAVHSLLALPEKIYTATHGFSIDGYLALTKPNRIYTAAVGPLRDWAVNELEKNVELLKSR